MALEVGSTAPGFTLTTYTGSGDNDGSSETVDKDNTDFQDKPILLSFVNAEWANDDVTNHDWLVKLHEMRDADTLNQYKIVVVIFKYSEATSKFTAAGTDDAAAAISNSGLPDSDFSTIHVFYDDNADASSVAKSYLDGIITDPDGAGFKTSVADHNMWTYILDQKFLITDKWHTECTTGATVDPISFNHLLTKSFDSKDTASTKDYATARINNLIGDLLILSSDPSDGSYINALAEVSFVFSRLVRTTPAIATGSFTLSGTGVSAGGGNCSSFDYIGKNKVENVITAKWTSAVLTDSTTDPKARVTVSGLYDTEDTAIAADFVEYPVDKTGPKPTLTLHAGSTSPTNASSITLDLDFGEPVTGFQASYIQVSANGKLNSTPTLADGGRSTTLDIGPNAGVTLGEISVQALAGAAKDSLGNSSRDSDPRAIMYDHEPPTPTITAKIHGTTTEVTNGTSIENEFIDVAIDFGEGMRATEALAAADLSIPNITIVGGAITADADNAVFSFQAQLTPDVQASISVTANRMHDLAGNLNNASSTFLVTYSPPVVTADHDLILLMDMSNSMNWPVTIESVQKPKIEYMRPAITLFLDKLYLGLTAPGSNVKTTDRIGLVQYASTAGVVQVNGSNLVTLGDAAANPVATVNTLTAGGNTAIGSGLANALFLLGYDQPSARKRVIIMFADGQDNIPPYLTADDTQYSIPGPDAGNQSGYPAGMGPVLVTATDPNRIPIYTIGISTEGHGDTSSWLNKLCHLSAVTAGHEYSSPTEQIWSDMETHLDNILNLIYSGSGPQIVLQTKGSMHTKESFRQAFVLDGGTKSIMVSVSWPGATHLLFTLRKAGHRIAQFTKSVRTGSYVIATLTFPFLIKSEKPETADTRMRDFMAKLAPLAGFTRAVDVVTRGAWTVERVRLLPYFGEYIDAAGNWEIEVARLDSDNGRDAPFSLSIIAMEGDLGFTVELPKAPVFTGSPIDLGIKVWQNGHPVNALKSAEVVITGPRVCIGTIIKKYEKELKYDPGKTTEDSLRRLREALRRVPAAMKELKQVGCFKTAFKAGATGQYLARLDAFKVPGNYQLDFYLLGATSRIGAFSRRVTHTLSVLPRVDWKSSVLKESYDPHTHILTVLVEPKDSAGNLLGPGYSDSFRGLLANAKILEVKDYLNGTYLVRASQNKAALDEGKQAKVTLFGHTIWKSGATDFGRGGANKK